jgi:hypothetical protein
MHDKDDINPPGLQFPRQDKSLPFHPAWRKIVNVDSRRYPFLRLRIGDRIGRILVSNAIVDNLHRSLHGAMNLTEPTDRDRSLHR